MNRKEIKELLNQKYERTNFKQLTQSIFSKCDYFNSPKSIDTNNDKVLDFLQLGNINLLDGKNLAIFELKLRKDTNIYKNKVELRNLTTKYIDQATNHGVFVVYDNQGDDYRLTFATKYTEIDNQGNIIKKETESKRYSYLLGKNESCITPSERLKILFEKKDNLNLNDITLAFSVDKLTDSFFIEYKDLYLELYDELIFLRKKNKNIDETFIKNDISNEEFAKKLLAQIIFVYFLQKKGWLGLKLNKNNNFTKWGEGSKKFFIELFNKKFSDYKNFFNDILEPLFVAFSTDLVDNYYKPLECKIPFLNGGLFDPIKNYNWSGTDLNISNKYFAKIIEVFGKYNFTVNEEDEFDAEVAIDPEMLGKIFENLLEIQDRKSKGTFYTPRKIVKYMCNNSLKIFLENKLSQKFSKELINNIFSLLFSDNEKIDSSFKKISSEIDKILSEIKICDPAIGSGAFPIEIMNLIVNIRNKLNIFFNNSNRNSYYFKKNFIENSLYGNDIDNSAIETAKLRLWLSLIIDEDSYEKIRTLPNLDFKIVNGNSLNKIQKTLLNLPDFNKIEKLKKELLYITNISQKNKYKFQIQNLFNQITNNTKKFDYEAYFSEIVKDKGGFDIIISNPPYIYANDKKSKLIDEKEIKLLKKNYTFIGRKINSYPLFVEKALDILSIGGTLSYIIPNNWLTTETLGEMRKAIFNKKNVNIINIKVKVFKNASVDSLILFFINSESINNNIKLYELENELTFIGDYSKELLNFTNNKINYELIKNIENINLIKKIESNCKPLFHYCSVKQGPTPYAAGLGYPPQTKKMIKERIYSSTIKKDKSYKKFIPGRDVCRFFINWSGEYIKYGDNLANKGNKRIFEKGRILIQEIPSKSIYTINSVYTKDDFINNHSAILIYDFRDINPLLINAYLNSKIFSFWFILKLDKMQRKTFPRITINEVEKFIFNVNFLKNNRITSKIIEFTEKKMKEKSITSIDKKLDNLIYQIFELNNAEIEKIETYLINKFKK